MPSLNDDLSFKNFIYLYVLVALIHLAIFAVLVLKADALNDLYS